MYSSHPDSARISLQKNQNFPRNFSESSMKFHLGCHRNLVSWDILWREEREVNVNLRKDVIYNLWKDLQRQCHLHQYILLTKLDLLFSIEKVEQSVVVCTSGQRQICYLSKVSNLTAGWHVMIDNDRSSLLCYKKLKIYCVQILMKDCRHINDLSTSMTSSPSGSPFSLAFSALGLFIFTAGLCLFVFVPAIILLQKCNFVSL